MNCRQFNEFILSFKRGELPEDQAERFRAHMELCPPCVTYMEQYDTTIELGKGCYGEKGAPQQMPEELVRAILASVEPRDRPPTA